MLPYDTTAEIWLPVVGYEGIYSVSNLGRVRRDGADSGAHVARILRTPIGGRGYPLVSLSLHSRRRTVNVHILVTDAFLGPRPAGWQVNHRNGIKTDGRLSNLEYVSPAGNAIHASLTGLLQSGVDHWMRRYPERIARGERNGAHTHPERKPRGDAHWARQHPEWVRAGEQHGNAKLTDARVAEMRRLAAAGWSQTALAQRFGISQATAWAAIHRRTWRHVE